ncbi:Hypothetical protein NTJ_15816 [Nesidiocoris tenuis]|uniref:Uncharacterized protein n=1 Tax=Nesidiocoris tenuis TaxID=355587 RepID=A0ABN7BIC3_9HEMI|nr:Hypothetical protein NTJ_15816 [Nesidiocoris tenuis]
MSADSRATPPERLARFSPISAIPLLLWDNRNSRFGGLAMRSKPSQSAAGSTERGSMKSPRKHSSDLLSGLFQSAKRSGNCQRSKRTQYPSDWSILLALIGCNLTQSSVLFDVQI